MHLPKNTSSQTFSDDENSYSKNLEDYKIISTIGYGSSAVVHLAKYLPLDSSVAMKEIDTDLFENHHIDELRREIQIMSLSKHPNLLPIYSSFITGSKLYIITPFFEGGSCLDILKTSFPGGLDEVSIATILKRVLKGLVYLHQNNLVHRDIKAANILIKKNGTTKLADFGVSSSLIDNSARIGLRKTFVGTPCWMAPEVMEQSHGYNSKADIWSFGITCLELATGKPPLASCAPLKVSYIAQIEFKRESIEKSNHKTFSRNFKKLVTSCLKKDPNARLTAEELLKLKFFKFKSRKCHYLKQTILKNLTSAQDRIHHQNGAAFLEEENSQTAEAWDFSSDSTKKPQIDNSDKTAQSNERVIDHYNLTKRKKQKKKGRFILIDEEVNFEP
ncbi:hypothetical protein HK099_003758 [Clydaea vesicula]|uniref:Protein kinase domain-containing protein n=1 Tax=Clydaea vesicula TaxID=447962 RepID=A0AAD5UA16_9FUNG|nr:hypothetical protein HK099_003758 [Clydaea vesicula]